MASGTGTATLSFGAAPGTNVATVTVGGQAGITPSTHIEAWMMGDTTADHNAYEHMIAPFVVRCGSIVNGTSFEIMASSEYRVSGDFTVHWVWSN